MREDRSRWLQHSRAEGGQADGERDGAEREEEEERTVCSRSISPVLESSMETAGEENTQYTLIGSALVCQHVCVCVRIAVGLDDCNATCCRHSPTIMQTHT